MTNEFPLSGGEGEWDRGLWWMVLASGALHLIVITVLVLMPQRFLHHSPPLVSYSVDLVAPDRVGGTNIVQGGKGRVEGAPLVSAPAASKVEPPKPPPPPKVEAKVEPPKPEPPRAEPQKPPELVAKSAEPPKAEEKPKEDEMALAEKAKQPSPPPAPTAAKPEPSPQAKPQPSPKAVAKAEPPKKAQVDAKAVEAKKAAEAKAAADAKAAKEAAAAHERDERIAAAIRRVEQRSGVRGGGLGNKAGEQTGGSVSVGPGEGVGGTIKGVEYLLYYNQLLNRIKQSWAWAGTDRALEAVVRFNITEGGEILNVRIVQASGDASYDASVERAVRAVNPLAPPPEAYRKEFSDVELTFSPEQMQQ